MATKRIIFHGGRWDGVTAVIHAGESKTAERAGFEKGLTEVYRTTEHSILINVEHEMRNGPKIKEERAEVYALDRIIDRREAS